METSDNERVSSFFNDRDYADAVEQLMSTGSSYLIPNSKAAHASILYSTLFRHSKNEVLIFCRKLSASVFGHEAVLQEAVAAVRRRVRLSIIIQEAAPEESIFARWISAASSSEQSPFVSWRSASDNERIRKFSFNFAVMDSKAYRLEKDNAQIKATACMNGPSEARRLSSIFSKISLELDTPPSPPAELSI
jgi:hypothetical protein